MSSLGQYLGQVGQVIHSKDGRMLKELFKLDSDATFVAMQLAQRGTTNVATDQVTRQLGQGPVWGGIVAGYLQALVHVNKGEKVPACNAFRDRYAKALLNLVSDNVWVLPAVVGAAQALRVLSAQVDDDDLRRGGVSTNSQLQQCAMLLQQMFSRTAASKGEQAELKRAAAVAVACIMFKVYFRLNTLTNCKNVMQQTDSLRIFDNAQTGHKVTYRYYTGRLAAYDENFAQAEEYLGYALAWCHPQALANKRRVLRYLIPVKMLLGVLPSNELLQRYSLMEYADMATAVRTGDVGLLLRALDTHQLALVQAGTYLLLEKLQLAVYRRLFKKCALVHAAANPAKAAQMPLALFQAALEAQGVVKDDAELQCLVANLIYRRYIKGYIAYKQRVVVLAKADAFPPLNTVQLGDPFGV